MDHPASFDVSTKVGAKVTIRVGKCPYRGARGNPDEGKRWGVNVVIALKLWR